MLAALPSSRAPIDRAQVTRGPPKASPRGTALVAVLIFTNDHEGELMLAHDPVEPLWGAGHLKGGNAGGRATEIDLTKSEHAEYSRWQGLKDVQSDPVLRDAPIDPILQALARNTFV